MGVLLQVPVAGSQVPAVWHWSEAVHTTGFAPTQAPAAQASVCVHTLPSVQGVPSAWAGLLPAMGVWPHEPKTQESAVQGFRSSQAVASAQFGLMLTQFSPESPPVPV